MGVNGYITTQHLIVLIHRAISTITSRCQGNRSKENSTLQRFVVSFQRSTILATTTKQTLPSSKFLQMSL